MKITFSTASPYVRKALACAVARGITDQLEHWKITATDPAIAEFNPLNKVPTLVTDDVGGLFDSPVICEYLDTIGSAAPLFPSGAARWNALRLQALGDGIMDASQPRRREIGLRLRDAGGEGLGVELGQHVARIAGRDLSFDGLLQQRELGLQAGVEGPAALADALQLVLEHEANALVVEAGDVGALSAALSRLIDDPGLCAELSAAARATIAARFTAKVALAQIAGLKSTHLSTYICQNQQYHPSIG
jgi:glutathione S-transferase